MTKAMTLFVIALCAVIGAYFGSFAARPDTEQIYREALEIMRGGR